MAVIMLVMSAAAIRTAAEETAGAETAATETAGAETTAAGTSAAETAEAETGSAEDTGNRGADLNAYRYGLTGYIMMELLARNLPKKSVAYVTQIRSGSNLIVEDKDVYSGGYYRYALVEGVNTLNPAVAASYNGLGGITYDHFIEADPDMILYEDEAGQIKYYIVSAADLLNVDIIVTAGCISRDAFVASLGGREYKGILISDIPEAFYQEEEIPKNALTAAYLIGCAYSEIVNPVDMCAFYYNYFTGISDRAALMGKVNEVFAATRFYRGYPNTLNEYYDPENIRNMIRTGTWFFADNRSVFSQGAFEQKGMSSWEPDMSSEGGLYDRSAVLVLN